MANIDTYAKNFAGEMTLVMDSGAHKFPCKFYKVKSKKDSFFVELDSPAAGGGVLGHIPNKDYMQDVVIDFAWKAKPKGYFNIAELKQAQEDKIVDPEKRKFLLMGLFDDHRRFLTIYNIWRARTRNVLDEKDIKDVLFKSQEGFTWSKMDFDPVIKDSQIESYNCPTWKVILRNITNLDAFLAYIGSLFEEKSYRQQYLYMYGVGRNGKGSTIRFLEKILGQAFGSEEPPTNGNKHWTHGLLGKRLVAFTDCDSPRFFTSGSFLKLTGGDSVKMDPKGLPPFTVSINTKFMIASNERMDLTGGAANVRRIIYCEFKEAESGEGLEIPPQEFEKRLWDERAEFVGLCMAKYKELCPSHQEIPVDMEVTQDLVEEGEDHFRTIFNENFKLAAGCGVRQSKVMEIFVEMTKNTNPKEMAEFKKFLRRMKGVTNSTRRVNGKRNRYWVGVTLLAPEEKDETMVFGENGQL